MGGLGRAFERMGASLRKTVGGVAHTADRVEAAVADISAVSRSVAVASADQVRRIQQASDLMLEINQQVRGVSDSAQALNLSVEESSSSILELGATGDATEEAAGDSAAAGAATEVIPDDCPPAEGTEEQTQEFDAPPPEDFAALLATLS